MTSVQRFLSGRDNLARQATLTASSVRASTAIERIAAQRAGGGRVRLAGSYTGHEAAQVEVEVVSADGVPRASVPQFVGVGNGQLAVLGVDAAAPLQALSLTLADLGVETATAGLDVREVRIRARVAGAAGNAIHITVQPALVRTATSWALLSQWSAGQPVQTGPQWDFGGLPLSPKEELDAASPRIAFGFDPQVYRPWRRFKDGAWQFGLSPVLARDLPAGTAVHSVTGGYVVTVSDGVTSETFGDTLALPAQDEIVSFYDLLQALAGSTLVEVAGVVVADRTSGGQAAVDVPLRTGAWLLALGGKVRLASVAVPDGAPTQSVTVRCTNADVIGQERWAVSGDVSGALPAAATGVPYASAACIFTVPSIVPAGGSSGRWSFKFNPAARADTEGMPSLCVRPFRFGANARPLTATFRYARRPPADCKCSDMPTPKISNRCLGIGDDAMALDPEHASRLQALYEWRRDFMAANTVVGTPPPNYSAADMDFADAVVGTFAQGLIETYEEAAARDEWDLALLAMQADLAALDELGQYALWPRSSTVQNNLSTLYANPVTGKLYRCLAQMTNVYADQTQVNLTDATSWWADPADAAWDTVTSTPFTVAQAGGVGTAVATYQYIGAEKDLEPSSAAAQQQLVRRYSARMDYVRTLAGIVPKSESSSSDAGGCWIDHGDPFWWVDVDGYYLPAFTNQAYVSARRDTETGRAYSTMEFGFGLVVACPERLKLGDEVTIRIEQVDDARPYGVGDEATIQTVGAGPAWLAGGVDGTDVQTWRVLASASGALADYLVPTDGTAAPVYAQDGVELQIALGGIPFALGDAFSLAVEAGQFRWRQGGGAWEALADIPPDGLALLADGLEAHFEAGAAPSFVPGDTYAFDVHQPWAASHVQDAQAPAWGWEGADASMVVDLGSVQPIGAIGLARYRLAPGAEVSAEFSGDGVAWSLPLVLDVSRRVCVGVFHLALQAQYVRLSVASAPGGSIGWVWCGQPMAAEHHASACQRQRRWASTRGSGINAAALYAGAGDGWRLDWSGVLSDADAEALLGMVDWAQAHDEPLLFVPHHLHEADAALVRCAADALDVSDAHEYQPDNPQHRLLSASLSLDPVYA